MFHIDLFYDKRLIKVLKFKVKKICKLNFYILHSIDDISIFTLELLILYNNYIYFNNRKTIITDDKFDQLVEILKFKHINSKFIYGFNMTYEDIKDNQNVVLLNPSMLSLQKCYNINDYNIWYNQSKSSIIIMPKIDGIACSLKYNNGILISAGMRGNGLKGDNIINNILTTSNIPLKLSMCMNVEIRGELYIKKSIFKKYFNNKLIGSRSIVAGIIQRSIDKNLNNMFLLSFYAYDIIGINCFTEEDKLNFLKSLKFNIPSFIVKKTSINMNIIFYKYFNIKNQYDFETDGIVIKYNNIAVQKYLGVTYSYPKFAIAYKYNSKSVMSKLIRIVWSIGRENRITPIAIIKPVFIQGALINKVSLYNINVFVKLKLKVNSIISIIRKGGIIPYIEKILYSSGNIIKVIKFCPGCKSKVVRIKNFIYCTNGQKCSLTIIKSIHYYCKMIKLYGFGIQLIKHLVFHNIIHNIHDIYKLNISDLISIKNINNHMAHKLLLEINNNNNIDFANFLTALGIPHIGYQTAVLITKFFYSFDNLQKAVVDDIKQIIGIGEKKATLLVKTLNKRNMEIYNILKHITLYNSNKIHKLNKEHRFYKKNIVFTGKMMFLKRAIAQKHIYKLGGYVSNNVSVSTNYLIKGISKYTTNKEKKSYNLIKNNCKLTIMNEKEFIKIINYVSCMI